MKHRKNLISARVVADSLHSLSGKRITTLIVTLPRIVLAEFNTHRAFSRNSGSSRAIPFKRMKESVKKNLFIPLAFQKHHTGMQGTEYHETGSLKDKMLVFLWWFASKMAILSASLFYKCGATKQLANRLLEPFMWHTIICTATEFENFFNQRCPQYGPESAPSRTWEQYLYGDNYYLDEIDEMRDVSMSKKLSFNKGSAEIHISLAAEAIYDAMKNSTPEILYSGMWHIPFRYEIFHTYPQNEAPTTLEMVKISTALCAMVSFTEVGGKSLFDKINPESNIKLHDSLIEDEHMSPTEHCSQVSGRLKPGEHSNFKGNWLQYRKIVEKNLHR